MTAITTTLDFGMAAAARGRSAGQRLLRPDELSKLLFPLYEDVVTLEDDFEGDTLDANKWLVTTDTGPTGTIPAAPGISGGWLLLNNVADNNEFLSIMGHPIWGGAQNPGMAVRCSVRLFENTVFELGFVSALTDATLPAVTDVDTPAVGNGATHLAAFHMDTSQTFKGLAFVTDNNVVVAADEVLSAAGAQAIDGNGIALKFVIQLHGTGVYYAIYNDSNPAGPVPIVQRIDHTARVATAAIYSPYVLLGNRTATQHDVAIDKVQVWGERPAGYVFA